MLYLTVVEKVVVMGRFLGMSSVHQCPGLQAAIAHAFCFLISSLDDISVAVAQRAYLYLTTLPDSGLRALCWCLEQQVGKIFCLTIALLPPGVPQKRWPHVDPLSFLIRQS